MWGEEKTSFRQAFVTVRTWGAAVLRPYMIAMLGWILE
jgi:hypothetical protein